MINHATFSLSSIQHFWRIFSPKKMLTNHLCCSKIKKGSIGLPFGTSFPRQNVTIGSRKIKIVPLYQNQGDTLLSVGQSQICGPCYLFSVRCYFSCQPLSSSLIWRINSTKKHLLRFEPPTFRTQYVQCANQFTTMTSKPQGKVTSNQIKVCDWLS